MSAEAACVLFALAGFCLIESAESLIEARPYQGMAARFALGVALAVAVVRIFE